MLVSAFLYLIIMTFVVWTMWPTLSAHKKAEHGEALIKGFFLWFISSLPVIFSVLLSRPDQIRNFGDITKIAGSPFSPAEQFVYASAFIAPALFVFIDTFRTFLKDKNPDRIRRFKSTLRHYDRVLLPSLIILILSTALFVGLKVGTGFERTNLYAAVYDKAILVYLVSVFYWYCVILIETPPDTDVLEDVAGRTQSTVDEAARRLGETVRD